MVKKNLGQHIRAALGRRIRPTSMIKEVRSLGKFFDTLSEQLPFYLAKHLVEFLDDGLSTLVGEEIGINTGICTFKVRGTDLKNLLRSQSCRRFAKVVHENGVYAALSLTNSDGMVKISSTVRLRGELTVEISCKSMRTSSYRHAIDLSNVCKKRRRIYENWNDGNLAGLGQ